MYQRIYTLLFSLLYLASNAQINAYEYPLSSRISLKYDKETAQKLAQLGRTKEALMYADGLNPQIVPKLSQAELDEFKTYKEVDARKYVLEQAKKSQIVIINELSYIPQHRAFTLAMLQELKADGFKFFLAEAVGHDDDSLSIRKYPTAKSAANANLYDPLYADMVRTAIELGFEVVPYCSQRTGLNPSDKALDEIREIHRIFRKDPNARIVIHASFADAMEKAPKGWEGTLAMRVYTLTNINPLTIDQVSMAEHSLETYDNAYRQALGYLNDSKIYLHPITEKPFVEPAKTGFFDVQIFHPRSVYRYNRSQSMNVFGQRRQLFLDLKGINDYPLLVQAFVASETGQGLLPVDQIEILKAPTYDRKTGENLDPTTLFLPPGKRLIIQYKNYQGKVIKEDKMSVN
jgi:hypothetical protein